MQEWWLAKPATGRLRDYLETTRSPHPRGEDGGFSDTLLPMGRRSKTDVDTLPTAADSHPPAGKTCDHCNARVNGDGPFWQYEIGLWFCPSCKHSYWHSEACLIIRDEAADTEGTVASHV